MLDCATASEQPFAGNVRSPKARRKEPLPMAVPLVDLNAQYQSIKADIDSAVARVFETSS